MTTGFWQTTVLWYDLIARGLLGLLLVVLALCIVAAFIPQDHS